jgi:hypothetical protein
MELKKPTYCNAMERFLFILPLITAFLVSFAKNVPQRMVAINIHDRLPAKRLALMFCFSGLSYRKGWITKRHWKRNQ